MTLTLNPTQAQTAALYIEAVLTPNTITGTIKQFILSVVRFVNPDAFQELRSLEDLRNKLRHYGYEYDRKQRRPHSVPYPFPIPDELADSLYFMLVCGLSNPSALRSMAILSLPGIDPTEFLESAEGLRDRLERHLVQIGRFSDDVLQEINKG